MAVVLLSLVCSAAALTAYGAADDEVPTAAERSHTTTTEDVVTTLDLGESFARHDAYWT